MIKLRIDVDYPFPSRWKSFLYVAFGLRISNDYLKNSKIIADMINESPEDIEAHWFFTPKTIPDTQMLALTNNSKHKLELHVVNGAEKELMNLEKVTGRKSNYYTFHGTERLLTRIMWKRWSSNKPTIPKNFRLQSYHDFPTLGIDKICFSHTPNQAIQMAENYLAKGYVLYFHPIWLFQKGTINQRSAYYRVLKAIFRVDNDLESVKFSRKASVKIAHDTEEYEKDVIPTKQFLEKIRQRDADIFSFIERRWCNVISNPPRSWVKTADNVALLTVTTYDDWWKNVGKKTRNMVRKAEKSGVTTRIAEPNEELVEGVWRIYNETPIRQERSFPHYGISLKSVKDDVFLPQNCTQIVAHIGNELVGFIRLLHRNKITIVAQILSLQKHWDKAINNALIAKAVEACAGKGEKWLMYARMGNHPTLDAFKKSNRFVEFPLTRYYIPLTRKGRIAVRLGLHRDLRARAQDFLPNSIKYRLVIPVYNWASRTKVKAKLLLKRQTPSR